MRAAEHRLRPAHLGRRHPARCSSGRTPSRSSSRQGAVFLQTEGRLEGLLGDEDRRRGRGPARTARGRRRDGRGRRPREKVIVRSNGTVTYVGKDIAYQFWKFGLLGRDFYYRQFATRTDGAPLWATTSDAERADAGHPAVRCGARLPAASSMCGSHYLQKLLKQALAAMGHPRKPSTRRTSHARWWRSRTRRREGSGYAPSGRRREQAVRRGLGTQGPRREGRRPDAIDWTRTAAEQVASGTPICPPGDRAPHRPANRASAAVRYFMIKYSRGKVIAFDIDEALSFEGEAVRICNTRWSAPTTSSQKLKERLGVGRHGAVRSSRHRSPDALTGADGDHELWAPGARGLPARRGRSSRSCAPLEFCGPGEVCASAWRRSFNGVLPPRPDPQRGAARTSASGAPPPRRTVRAAS